MAGRRRVFGCKVHTQPGQTSCCSQRPGLTKHATLGRAGLFTTTTTTMQLSDPAQGDQQAVVGSLNDDVHPIWQCTCWSFKRTALRLRMMLVPGSTGNDYGLSAHGFTSSEPGDGACESARISMPPEQRCSRSRLSLQGPPPRL